MIRNIYKFQCILRIMETKEAKMDTNELLLRLSKLQKDMNYIKEHIEDIILTEDDLETIKEAKKDLKEGKTRRL